MAREIYSLASSAQNPFYKKLLLDFFDDKDFFNKFQRAPAAKYMHHAYDQLHLYLQYELTLKGYQSIYLGQSVPLESLEEIQKLYPNVVFATYLTVEPQTENLKEYINDLSKLILNYDNKAWILGRKVSEIEKNSPPNNVKLFNRIKDLLNII